MKEAFTHTHTHTCTQMNILGLEVVRKTVANFISARDGVTSNPNNIFLSSGASESVQSVLFSLIASPNVGVSDGKWGRGNRVDRR